MVAVDVGNHAYSFGRHFKAKPGQWVLMSGYLNPDFSKYAELCGELRIRVTDAEQLDAAHYAAPQITDRR